MVSKRQLVTKRDRAFTVELPIWRCEAGELSDPFSLFLKLTFIFRIFPKGPVNKIHWQNMAGTEYNKYAFISA